jgi:multisubunit Na+/H+ antiporter MnhE subunit
MVACLALIGWTAFTGSFSLQEILLGIGCALLSSLLCIAAWKRMGLLITPRVKDAAQAWRLPWYLLSGSWEVTVVLAKHLTGTARAGSLFRSVPFEASKDRASDTLRRVLAVACTTVAPNFIVLGVDRADAQLLFHQLAKSGIPQMTQRLGARQ